MKNKHALHIGEYSFYPPIVQGRMGVQVSTAPLVTAVCQQGGIGVIASVGLGETLDNHHIKHFDYIKRSCEALREQIKSVRSKTDRPFGVNIMCVLSNYDDLVKVCVEEKVAFIFSGAGLPLHLPKLTKGSVTKMIPIVSSAKAAQLIINVWEKKYQAKPAAFVVEGPLAGGHLGFKRDQISHADYKLDNIVPSMLEVTKGNKIPVIVGGGVFTGADIAKFLKMGCSGVQMATRFVCTEECDISMNFKQMYINATKDDIEVINSPVGMPGRAIRNKFLDKVYKEKISFDCDYQCLRTCYADKSNYCIAKALLNAVRGDMDNGLIMCGSNAYRVNKIVPVKNLMNELATEMEAALK